MPLPFILGGVALATAGLGIKKGIDAKEDFARATHYQETAHELAAKANDDLEAQKNQTNDILISYGQTKQRGGMHIKSFNSCFHYPEESKEHRHHQISVGRKIAAKYPKIIITKEEEAKILSDLNIINRGLTIQDALKEVSARHIEMEKLQGALQSVTAGSLAGLAAGGGAYLGVGQFAFASTGAAISGLSGAAAKSATLAWLGGGSLASGGLGVAGGTMVLGGLVAGPLLAIGGAVIASQAAEKRQEAYEHLKNVEVDVEKLKVSISKLNDIEAYTNVCNITMNKLIVFFHKKLEQLETVARKGSLFKDLTDSERRLVYICYELNYILYDFIDEPTMNADGSDVIAQTDRQIWKKLKKMQYTYFG